MVSALRLILPLLSVAQALVIGADPTSDLALRDGLEAVLDSRCSTNAECLKKGLPLRKPQKRNSLAPRTSSLPCNAITRQGKIKATGSTGNILYVADPGTNDGLYYFDVESKAAYVKFTFCADNSGLKNTLPFNIELVAPQILQYPFPGFLAQTGNNAPTDDLTTANTTIAKNALWFGALAQQTAPCAPPNNNNGALYTTGNGFKATGSESAVWSFDLTTKDLTASWVNTDGTVIPLQIYAHTFSSGTYIEAAGNYTLVYSPPEFSSYDLVTLTLEPFGI